MENFGIVGVSWRQGGSDAVARFTLPVEGRGERLREVFSLVGARELLYLATCNRVEVALVTCGKAPLATYRARVFRALAGRDGEPGEDERTFRTLLGIDAVRHLAEVAAGLDSAMLGEREIRGQLRAAHRLGREVGIAGPELERLVGASLRLASSVHERTGLGSGRTSLAEIAIDAIRERLGRSPGAVALVGVSAVTRLCADRLQNEAPLVVVNRTLERAAELAAQCGARARSLVDFRRDPDRVVAVLLATSAPGPVLDTEALGRLARRSVNGEPPLLLDMALPPDVDPHDALAAGLPRLGMDEISERADRARDRRSQQTEEARSLIAEGIEELRRGTAQRSLSPVLATLAQRFRDTAVHGLEALFARELAGLEDDERQALLRWAETLARRLAHIPTLGLRGLAAEAGDQAVETFLEAADPTLLDALERPPSRRQS